MEKKQPTMTFLTASPLQLEFDAGSGMLRMMWNSTFAANIPAAKTAEEIIQPVRVGLTRGVAEKFIADVKRLESSLAPPGNPPPATGGSAH